MQSVNGKTITLTKGDTLIAMVTITDQDGNVYTPQEGDSIRFAAKQDYEGFYLQDIELRRVQKCPPFTQIISLSVTGVDESQVLRCCTDIKRLLKHALGTRLNTDILGPAPYPVVKVAGKFRYKLILRCQPDREVRATVSKILIHSNTQREYRGVSVYADMNPLV